MKFWTLLIKEKNKMFDLLRYAYEDLKSMDNVKIEKMKRDSKILKLQQENEELNNILTEFEKWLEEAKERIKFFVFNTEYIHARNVGYYFALKDCKDKLQELKGDKDATTN